MCVRQRWSNHLNEWVGKMRHFLCGYLRFHMWSLAHFLLSWKKKLMPETTFFEVIGLK